MAGRSDNICSHSVNEVAHSLERVCCLVILGLFFYLPRNSQPILKGVLGVLLKCGRFDLDAEFTVRCDESACFRINGWIVEVETVDDAQRWVM